MPSVYSLERLRLAINVWIDFMQNFAKLCKLFMRYNLTDFALFRCPVSHNRREIPHTTSFQGFPSLCEGGAPPASSQRPYLNHALVVFAVHPTVFRESSLESSLRKESG